MSGRASQVLGILAANIITQILNQCGKWSAYYSGPKYTYLIRIKKLRTAHLPLHKKNDSAAFWIGEDVLK
jgi:hypothetical protein